VADVVPIRSDLGRYTRSINEWQDANTLGKFRVILRRWMKSQKPKAKEPKMRGVVEHVKFKYDAMSSRFKLVTARKGRFNSLPSTHHTCR